MSMSVHHIPLLPWRPEEEEDTESPRSGVIVISHYEGADNHTQVL